jgi:hypothetical protein
MSLLATIEKFLPRAWKPLNFLFLGSNPAHRMERASISVMAIFVVVVASVMASSGTPLFSAGFGNTVNVTYASYHVGANPDSIFTGNSLFITASVNSYIPRTTISVSITIVGPCSLSPPPPPHPKHSQSPPSCSGYTVLGAKELKLTTDSHGNGQVSIVYPLLPPFSGTASTTKPGTYYVSATFSFVYSSHTAFTSFQVRQHGNDGQQDFRTGSILVYNSSQ